MILERNMVLVRRNQPSSLPAYRERGLVSLTCAIIAFLTVGCETQPAPPTPTPINQVTYGSPNGAQPIGGPIQPIPPLSNMSPDQVVNSGPTAMRLQDIEGVMLQFYALNRRLPNSLEELKPLEDPGTPADFFDSPTTHAPFTYSRIGLGQPNNSKRMILYESVPNRSGQRWCILMPPLTNDRSGAVSMEVVQLPEVVFRQFSAQR